MERIGSKFIILRIQLLDKKFESTLSKNRFTDQNGGGWNGGGGGPPGGGDGNDSWDDN